jgi:hypothetical protein
MGVTKIDSSANGLQSVADDGWEGCVGGMRLPQAIPDSMPRLSESKDLITSALRKHVKPTTPKEKYWLGRHGACCGL